MRPRRSWPWTGLTHEGMTTGTVTLAGRPVHVGVWFRLLRILIEELNTPISYLRPSTQVARHSVGGGEVGLVGGPRGEQA